MRILNAMLGRGLGGLEQALLDYCDALARFGHEVHALIHPDAAIRPGLEARGVRWHGLSNLGAWDVIAATRLRALLRHLRPDVCVAHGNRAMSLLRQAGANPIIAVLPNYKMKCQGAAGVFYPTQHLKRHAQSRGVPEDRLYHVPSMVEVPSLPPHHHRRTPPMIGAMGRFVAKKGFDVFIDALARLKSQGVTFHAMLAGDGPERPALEYQATKYGLRDSLSFPGWIDDKPGFFADIDVFCLPSHHEPFGIVLIEAMAHAMPIVTTDSEGPSEIVRNGLDGIVVPRGDAGGLAEALGVLLAEEIRANQLAANAYRRAQETFDVPWVGALIDQAVRQIAQRDPLEATA